MKYNFALEGEILLNGEDVKASVEFREDRTLGKVLVLHLPEGTNTSNFYKSIYIKTDLK